MFKKLKEEDSIHVRAIRYGVKHPNGFMYADIEYYYSKRLSEWTIVDEYLNEAWNNKNGITNHITPFVLLEKMGTVEKSKYTLTYEAYFAYLQYRNAKNAQLWAIIAVAIAILTMIISIVFSCLEIKLSISNSRVNTNMECCRKNHWDNEKNMFGGDHYEHIQTISD